MERRKTATIIRSESRRRFLTVAGSSLLFAACATPPGDRPPRSGFAEASGGRLYYETAGEGTPVLLLHAFMLDTRMWDAQFEALASSFRVIRYDARGFGRSSLPAGAYSHHDDLRALLLHLGISKAHLVGASMGGRLALDFALAYPDQCLSLALIDPVIGGWKWSPEWLSSYAPVVQAAQRGDLAAAKAAWLAHPIFAPARTHPAVYGRLRQMVGDYSGWHFTHADPAQELSPAAVEQLGRLRVPLLSLVGEKDMADFQRMAELIQKEARAQRSTLAGVGHLASMEAPQQVNQVLQNFLG